MSGGVDSSVAAAILKREGHEVTGMFLKTGVVSPADGTTSKRCCSLEDGHDAARVADRLGIGFYSVDFSHHFQRIMDDFAQESLAGRTPNPCVRCNQWLKFDAFWDLARAFDAEGMATGHYARVERGGGAWHLLRARDPSKDQSYVLFPLGQAQLSRTRFPLGDLAKDRVRALARDFGLSVADKPESQDICFLPRTGDKERFLAERGGDRPGAVLDTSGRRVGTHRGVAHFTIGQRRGLGVASTTPRYVVSLDPASDEVVVGTREDLLGDGFRARDVRWVGGTPPGEPFDATAQIRYRHSAVPCRVEPLGVDGFAARFDKPQAAVTPGQAAVLYDGDEVVGGGWIDGS